MSDEELEAVDASDERPENADRFVRVRLGTLQDAIGILSAKADDRRGAADVISEIRRRIALAGHPAAIGSDDDDDDEAG